MDMCRGEERRGENLKIRVSRRRGRPKLKWNDNVAGDLRQQSWERGEVLDSHLWKRRSQ